MIPDRRTIGLNPKSREVVEKIKMYFMDQKDAAKFAMALAMNEQLEPGTTEGADTTWNIGTFDPDGTVRQLIEALYPNVEGPYRAVEYFINAGFDIIASHLGSNSYLDLAALMSASIKEK